MSSRTSCRVARWALLLAMFSGTAAAAGPYGVDVRLYLGDVLGHNIGGVISYRVTAQL